MKFIHLLLKVLIQVYRVSPKMFFGVVGINLIQAVLPVAQIYITAKVINSVTSVLAGGTTPVNAIYWLALQLSALLLALVLQSIKSIIERKMDVNVTFWFNLQVSNKLNQLPFVFFEEPESYDKLQRALRNLHICGIKMVFYILSVVQSVITLLGLTALLFSFHYSLPFLMLVLVIPLLIIQKKEGSSRFVVIHKQTSSSRMASYINQLLQSKEAAKEIRLFNSMDFLIGKWRSIYFKNSDEMLAVERKNTTNRLWAESVVTIFSFAILAVFIWAGTRIKLTIGSYVALFQAVQDTRYSIQGISQNIGQIYHDGLFIEELFQFLETSIPEQPKALPMPSSLRTGIEVRNMSFRYPHQENNLLNDISFQIAPGEKIAIVGENGAGKSTLVKLLLGLYQPSSGEVLYEGQPLQNYEVKGFRKKVTAVFQDFYQYEFSLETNITLQDSSQIDSIAAHNERLSAAISKASLESVIDKLPDGVNTQLGTRFSGGRELSQGQWQKVAIARAFYRDFDVIFLDEPTAAVDPITESAIFENLMMLTEGKTAVFISHRLGSCRQADRILVLHNGSIVEEGDHEELMIKNGYYATMFNKQAQWYL